MNLFLDAYCMCINSKFKGGMTRTSSTRAACASCNCMHRRQAWIPEVPRHRALEFLDKTN